jgi:hypothetical protein
MRFGGLALVIVAQAGGAHAAWVMNERNECVRAWTPASLARGPSAVLNAPLVPLRSAAGGVRAALDTPRPSAQGKVLLPPLLGVAGGAMGLVDALVWLGTGLADTATGGYFEVAPEEATELSLRPLRPAFVEDGRRATLDPARKDPCGRPSSGPPTTLR